jgi:hypothetical protein
MRKYLRRRYALVLLVGVGSLAIMVACVPTKPPAPDGGGADLAITPVQHQYSFPLETHKFIVTNQGSEPSGPLTVGFNLDHVTSFRVLNDTCSGTELAGGDPTGCAVDITYVPQVDDDCGTFLVVSGEPGGVANAADDSSFDGAALVAPGDPC